MSRRGCVSLAALALPAMLLGGTVEAQTPLAPSQPVDGAELPAAPIAATPLPAAELQAAELPAAAAPTLDGLHDELRQLRSEVAALKQAQSPLPSPPELQPAPSAAVERPSFRISPELQLDNYFFGQNTESRNTVGNIPDGAAFRRARIAVLGDYKQTEYRLEMDFAQPGRPSFLDVWGAINDLPYVGQLKIGNFFEPIGLERLTSNRFAPFLERNLPDQPFDPQRNPGIAIQNEYGNQRGLYTLGVFRPRIDAYDDAVTDTGDWAFDGRFTFMPFYDEASGGRYYMHLGTAHSYRRTTNHTISFAAQPEARLGASVPNVPFFIATGDIDAVDYLIHEVEFAWSLGSVYLQAEYFWLPVGRINGPDLMFTGWYAQIGWYLTGEHRPFRRETGTFDRVLPFTEFFRARTRQGVVQGCGAWELAARISQCDLTDRDVGGGKLTDLTVGLNWYLTPYMRLQTNYIHAFLDPAAASNTGADIIGTRMQYDF